jgi:hypothetical protein
MKMAQKLQKIPLLLRYHFFSNKKQRAGTIHVAFFANTVYSRYKTPRRGWPKCVLYWGQI